MNEIEKILADVLINEIAHDRGIVGNYTWQDYKGQIEGLEIYPQYNIGKYKADFCLINDNEGIKTKYVVEVDGQDSHKTKEQRQYDYARERYFQKEGYRVIRFTGSDVYNDPKGCAAFILSIIQDEDEKVDDYIATGRIIGVANMFKREESRQVECFAHMCSVLKNMPKDNIQKVFTWSGHSVFSKAVIMQKAVAVLDRGLNGSLGRAFIDIDDIRDMMKIDVEGRNDK